MRPFSKTLALVTASALLAGAGTAAVFAQDEDEEEDAGPTPEQIQLAKDALAKAVARGKELWGTKDLPSGTVRKSCAQCHDDAEKPKLDLAKREYSYPAYSRRKKGVVTLQQKINEMIKFNGRGKLLDAEGSDIAALEAYVVSLRKK